MLPLALAPASDSSVRVSRRVVRRRPADARDAPGRRSPPRPAGPRRGPRGVAPGLRRRGTAARPARRARVDGSGSLPSVRPGGGSPEGRRSSAPERRLPSGSSPPTGPASARRRGGEPLASEATRLRRPRPWPRLAEGERLSREEGPPRRRLGPAPDASLPATSSSFDSLSRVLFVFPSRYLSAIGLSPVFGLGWGSPPAWGCDPEQPDSPGTRRGRDEARDSSRGCHPLGHSVPGDLRLGPRPGERVPQDHNSREELPRFSVWAFPASLAATGGIPVGCSSSA